ncbi:MAG: transposase [Aestuariivita sp.]|nr:transposase [Aestuariivita sp.]MCY4346393.1 transposase [Aestuariivita sp.]
MAPGRRSPCGSGQPAIDDFEYERNGTANRFMVCAPLAGWRPVKVTDRLTRQDFAELLKDLADDDFPNQQQIVLVMDNRNTHKLSVLYDRHEPAARIARQIAVY